MAAEQPCPQSNFNYKIWGIIQQRVHSTKVQDVKDLMSRLIDAWAGVEERVIQDVIDHRRRRLHTAFSHCATGGYYEYSHWQKLV